MQTLEEFDQEQANKRTELERAHALASALATHGVTVQWTGQNGYEADGNTAIRHPAGPGGGNRTHTMSTRYGTAHFRSIDAAVNYYAKQDIPRSEVMDKMNASEIFLGPPSTTAQQTLTMDTDGRYWVHDPDPHDQPTYTHQLYHARKLLAQKGRTALDNPHAMIGRQCGCGSCFVCAAAQVIQEFDAGQPIVGQ